MSLRRETLTLTSDRLYFYSRINLLELHLSLLVKTAVKNIYAALNPVLILKPVLQTLISYATYPPYVDLMRLKTRLVIIVKVKTQ